MPHDEEPQTHAVTADGASEGDGRHRDARPVVTEDVPLDVRTLPHAQRHATIFGLLPRLNPGQALVLTVDHDPQPLRYQLQALHAGAYGWEYLERGPRLWRVAVRRNAHDG